MLTALIIRMKPNMIRGVSDSWNTVTPKNTAVTGSKAPRMAVGVEPIYCMAPVVQSSDMAVGIRAKATRQHHSQGLSAGGVCIPPAARVRQTNISHPKRMT